ncbi:hypothetical protein Taro_002281 [Colocasia esculenta]|uniref:DYW domain-containing protein n=1 Tax=Colocasia esculenta TaxID=4460 RepID=A0A843TIA1_COLES|nr:hypothetical protein [Colocasia esculenta]
MLPKPPPVGLPSRLGLRFLKGFLDSGDLQHARALFDESRHRDLRSWTLLISAYTKQGFPMEGVKLYTQLLREGGLKPDKFALLAAVKACGAAADLGKARELHGDVVGFGLQADLLVGNALIDMYGKCRFPDGARSVFDGMPHVDVISWTSVIAAYVSSNRSGEAFAMLREMRISGMRPNSVTLSKVFSICSDTKSLNLGRELHCFAVRNGFEDNIFVCSGLVDMYAKCSSIHQARSIFDSMPRRDAVSWNMMLAASFSNGDCEEAFKLFHRMEAEGVALNLASWNSMICGCVENGRIKQALTLLARMQDFGFKPNKITIASILPACTSLESLRAGKEVHGYSFRQCFMEDMVITTSLLLMYSKCGNLDMSRKIFSAMSNRDIVAWNTMILANSMHGYGGEALALFHEMQKSGMRPNSVTFMGALCGCSHSNLVEEGRKIFHSMSSDYGVMPDADHHSCMVDVLSRAGLLTEAYEFIQKMPLKPTAGAWGALLAGCRVYKNVELGKIAANHLFEIEPENPGNYVLLSNIFVAANLWDDASKIRKIMRDRGIAKEPGCSWIQTKNRIYTFVKGDKRHAQSDQIYGFLREVAEKMRLEGILPDTDSVLQDVDKEEKEELLCSHSEKLAVAFGILNLNGGSSIRVFKNLRICGDCHNTIKFIAMSFGVRITVRDSLRFHHFQDESCSCHDFW